MYMSHQLGEVRLYQMAVDNCYACNTTSYKDDLVLLFFLSIYINTMRGQGGHGSRGRSFRNNIFCKRIRLSMRKELVQKQDYRVVDDLRES